MDAKQLASIGRAPLAAPPSPKRQRVADLYFDPSSLESFPPKAPAMHPIEDYIENPDDPLPPEENYLLWLPEEFRPATGMQVDGSSRLPPMPAPESEHESPNKLRPRSGYHAAKVFPHLPLEYCDSPEMELVSPSDRLAQVGADSALPGVPAYSRWYNALGVFTWKQCYVTGYDQEHDTYTIQWKDSGKAKTVRRLNLLLDEESRAGFQFRVRQARRRQEEVEKEARFQEHVKRMAFVNHSTFDGYVPRIVKRASTPLTTSRAASRDRYLADAHEEYKFAVKTAIVEEQFLHEDSAAHLAAANVQPVKLHHPVPPKGCLDLTVFPPGRVVASCPDEYMEGADVRLEEMLLLLSDVQASSYLAQPPLLAAMQFYHARRSMAGLQLVDTELVEQALPLQLPAFCAAQQAWIKDVTLQLAYWVFSCETLIKALMAPAAGEAAAADKGAAGAGDGAHGGGGSGLGSDDEEQSGQGMNGAVDGECRHPSFFPPLPFPSLPPPPPLTRYRVCVNARKRVVGRRALPLSCSSCSVDCGCSSAAWRHNWKLPLCARGSGAVRLAECLFHTSFALLRMGSHAHHAHTPC